jgi:hypothetical protein
VPTPPTTFDEVKTMSADIKAAGTKYGFLRQVGDPYHFYPIQTAFGGYIFGQNADGSYNAEDLGLNSEGSVAALSGSTACTKMACWIATQHHRRPDALCLPEWRRRDGHLRPVGDQRHQGRGRTLCRHQHPGRHAAGRALHGRPGLHGQRVQQEPTAGADLPPDLRSDRRHHAGLLRPGPAHLGLDAGRRQDRRPGPEGLLPRPARWPSPCPTSPP